MACEVCQHCETSVEPGEVALCNGYSYHRHCHNCYVCGETDLRNAETFRGVIFCSGCSKRIFQGCSTARQAKSSKARRRSPRRRRTGDRVIEMTMKSGDTYSRSSLEVERFKDKKAASPENKFINRNQLEKKSTERGTTTVVTQETLKQVDNREAEETQVITTNYPTRDGATCALVPSTPVKPRKKRKTCKHKHNKRQCSDLRIAELGASFEIAHMALRKQSEVPVIIKSMLQLKQMGTRSLSMLNQESDMSEGSSKWGGSMNSIENDASRTPWTNRGLTSILKMPLRSFKRNILDRSSLISVMQSSESYVNCPLAKLKMLFNEGTAEHHRNGLKKLYPTINRHNKPYIMGWTKRVKPKGVKVGRRCKHFKTSHSYRCMREQVMRLAGPTYSELAVIRGKILSIVSPSIFKNILSYNQKYAAILSSQANGRERRYFK